MQGVQVSGVQRVRVQGGTGLRGAECRAPECREVRECRAQGCREWRGCRRHRGSGLRDARGVGYKSAELRGAENAGVQRMQGRGAGFMSAGLRGAESAESTESTEDAG